MTDATISKGAFRRFVDVRKIGKDSDNLVVEYGEFAWSGVDVVADELALTYISQVIMPKFTKKSATGLTAADGEVVTDGVITAGAITVARTGHADNVSTVFYEITGRPIKS